MYKGFILAYLLLFAFIPASWAEEVLLKGSVERTVPEGTPVVLKIMSAPMQSGFYMENWDLEGRFIPPAVGAQITSELVKPVYVGQDLVLPRGTKFYGQVSKVIEPKRFGKDGRLEISFLGLETPKGKVLKFREPPAALTGKERTKKQEVAFGVARVGAYSAGGAAAGALIAYYAAGLFLTATNPYYVLGSGAGVGLLIGALASVVKKGRPGHLMPGDEIKINLQQSLVLPVAEPIAEMAPEVFMSEGVKVKTLRKSLVKDDFDRPLLLLDLELENRTQRPIYASDFVLLGPYNKQFFPDNPAVGFESYKRGAAFKAQLATAQPGERKTGQLAFEIDFPGFEHSLLLKDRYAGQTLYHTSIGNPADYGFQKKKIDLKKRLFGDTSDPWN